MIEEEVKNHSLSIKLNELQSIIDKYEGNINKLPKKSMEFAGYEEIWSRCSNYTRLWKKNIKKL